MLLIMSFDTSNVDIDGVANYLDGFTNIIFSSTVYSYNNDYLSLLKANGEIPKIQSLYTEEYVYYLWNNSKKNSASLLLQNLTEMLLPRHVGINYSINGETVYIRNLESYDRAITALSSQKITYKHLNITSIIGPGNTTVIMWQ